MIARATSLFSLHTPLSPPSPLSRLFSDFDLAYRDFTLAISRLLRYVFLYFASSRATFVRSFSRVLDLREVSHSLFLFPCHARDLLSAFNTFLPRHASRSLSLSFAFRARSTRFRSLAPRTKHTVSKLARASRFRYLYPLLLLPRLRLSPSHSLLPRCIRVRAYIHKHTSAIDSIYFVHARYISSLSFHFYLFFFISLCP